MRRGYCAGYGNNPPASVLRKKELHNFFITSLCGLRLEKPIHRRSVLEEVAIQGMYYQEKVREHASLRWLAGCCHSLRSCHDAYQQHLRQRQLEQQNNRQDLRFELSDAAPHVCFHPCSSCAS